MVSRRHLGPSSRHRRARYELLRASPLGRTLTVLRPDLGTVRLRVEVDWPAEIRAEARALAALNRRQQDAEPGRSQMRRPGTGPETVILDPEDDVQFELAVAVAPFSRTVEATSRDGVLVCGRGRTDGHTQLRLTAAQRAQLTDLAELGLLVERQPPEREDSLGSLVLAVGVLYWAAERLVWESAPKLALVADWPTAWATVKVGLGLLVIGIGGPHVVRSIIRRLRG